MQYPRPGEAIVPRLLRPLVIERRPATRSDPELDLLSRFDLGPEAWARLSAETCRRLSMLVVDRVQTRVDALSELTRKAHLPEPEVALTLPIESRTANTIRRELGRGSSGPWTVERYLGLRRFGGRALVDLLAAVEAHSGTASEGAGDAASGSSDGLASERALEAALALIVGLLPISETHAQDALVQEGFAAGPIDLGQLARTAVRLGRHAPFHIIDLGGARMIVRLSDVTAARASYRIAMRAVQGWGMATIRTVASQVRAVVHAVVPVAFVERMLVGTATFRWLDREGGWFWFMRARNPLVSDLRKVFSVATRLPLPRVWSALFRTRQGPSPSPDVLRQICGAVPGARLAGDVVTIDRPLDRAAHLSDVEMRIARLLETAPEGMSDSELRPLVRGIGLPWTPVWRLLRCSPVVERSPNGLYRLLGSAA